MDDPTAPRNTDPGLRIAALEAQLETLRSTLQSLGDSVLTTDVQGRVISMNPAAELLTGWTALEALGRSCDSVAPLFDQDTKEPVASPLARVLQDRERVFTAGRLLLVPRSGTARPVARTATPLQDGRGGINGVVIVLRDVSAERAVVDALRRSEDNLKNAQRIAQLASWEWNVVGDRITLAEETTTLFPGASPLNGGHLTSFLSVVHPDDREAVRAEIRAVLAGDRKSFDLVYRTLIPGGRQRVLHAVADLVMEDGRPVRLVGTAQDISERHALQEQLALADRMASVGTLAAGVAHEINNPLAYTIVNIDFALRALRAGRLETPADREELGEALSSAREGCERIRVTVKHMQTFSGPSEIDRTGPADVARAMESAITMAAAEIRHRARVVRDFRPVPLAQANESRLGQVFLNIIVNAMQAITEGAVERNTIALSTRVDVAGRIVAEIRDTGAGIPSEILPKIFDPFFTTKPVGVGTGLGLTVCHSIVQGAGGTMEVESTVGKGTLIRVILPPAKAATESVPASAEATPPPLRGRVFVIDDEEYLTRAIARALAGDHDVVTFHRAQEACERLAAGEPCDVILCDIMMPEMTGVDLYEELRERRPDLLDRFIFATGGAFTARAREFLERVPNRCLQKPFEMGTLSSAVRAVVRETRNRAPAAERLL